MITVVSGSLMMPKPKPSSKSPLSGKRPLRGVKHRSRSAKPSSVKPWGGRFSERTHSLVEGFTTSLPFDRRLYAHDIQGSIAHSKTLLKAKVLTNFECTKIIRGLERIRLDIGRGKHTFREEDEDIHMSIERRLTKLIGPLGGKLHTGRSRNDQVALDLRLYLRDSLITVKQSIIRLQKALLGSGPKAFEHHYPWLYPSAASPACALSPSLVSLYRNARTG